MLRIEEQRWSAKQNPLTKKKAGQVSLKCNNVCKRKLAALVELNELLIDK